MGLSLDWSGSVEDNIGVKEEEEEEDDRDNMDAEPEMKEEQEEEEEDRKEVKDNEDKNGKKRSGRTDSPKREVESPISGKGEMDEFMAEMEEECEGMQSTIYYLQQQLKEAKEKIANLEANAPDKETPENNKSEVKDEKMDESKDSSGQRSSLDWSGSVEDNIGVKEEEEE